MAMDFYFKDLYPNMGYVQTVEQTVPDGHDNAEIIENEKAAAVADNAKGTSVNKFKLLGVVVVVICLIALLGGKR